MALSRDFFRVFVFGVKEVARVGRHRLMETEFRLERADRHTPDAIQVPIRRLLTTGSRSGWETIAQANKATGVDRSTLRRWCRSKQVLSKKERGKWLLWAESLRTHMVDQGLPLPA